MLTFMTVCVKLEAISEGDEVMLGLYLTGCECSPPCNLVTGQSPTALVSLLDEWSALLGPAQPTVDHSYEHAYELLGLWPVTKLQGGEHSHPVR